jgi:polygalacturonase
MGFRARLAAVVAVCGMMAGFAGAQATGDSRTVVEPTFPAVCTVLTAQQAIVNDAPADETLYDTSRIQAALTACGSGKAVELSGASGKYAFLSASLNIPTGVGLIVDGGVTLYASRKASDYQVSGSSETCGSYGASGSACKYFFTFANGSSNTGCGIYGYGVIDLRGGSTILSSTGADTGVKWWTNADTATTAGQSQDNVSLMKPNKSTNLTLYKITIRNSPQFHVVTSNVSGETVWGVKIQAPYTAHNTDGIDPQGTNVSILNSSISDGDDAIAVSGSSATSNITIANTTIYSSHGISIGSYTQGGVSNMLVQNVNMAGEPADGNQNGIRIKSALDRGGKVNNITYQNMCLRDIYRPLYITPLYNTNSGTSYPNFTNILLQNIHVLSTTKTTKYYVSVAGINANYPTTMTLNNVVFDQVTGYSPAFSYSTIALAGNVSPASLQSQTGTGVTYTGTATSTATPAYDCSATAAVFPFIVGEMYVSTATATNLQTASISSGASVTLNAMVQPAKAQTSFTGTVGAYTGAAALTQPVNFYEGTTLVGTGTLGANATNNSLATLTLTGVTAGTHTYTAQYPGDSNYNALTFGSVTVTVAGATATSTTTAAVSGTLVYGATQTLTATVTGASGTPSGTAEFLDGTATLGSCTLASGSCTLGVTLSGGSGHSITAVYSGDTTFKASTSTAKNVTITVAPTATAVTAAPTTVSVNGTTVLSVTVTGVSSAATPTGTVSFTDGTTNLGNALLDGTGSATFTATMSTLGSRTIMASYAGDGNYSSSSGSAAVQVTTIATTTTLTASPNPATYGTASLLTATVAAASGTATGTVTFLDGSAAVSPRQV